MRQVTHLFSERDLLRRVQHHGVLRLLGAFQDAACVYFALQYAAGGELFRSIKQRGGRRARSSLQKLTA